MAISDIINSFIKNWQSKEELYLKIGTASSINEADFTFKFTPIDEGSPVEDVRMKVIVDSTAEAFVIVPKEGSKVVVGYHSSTVSQCLSVQQAEKVIINTRISSENAESKEINVSVGLRINCDNVVVSTDSWVFNGGSLGGLISIASLTNKINGLITELDDMKDSLNGHTHGGIRTGSGTSGPSSTSVDDFTPFNKADFEDTKIKH